MFEPRAGETALPVHVVDPIETVGLQPTSDGTENKKVSLINHQHTVLSRSCPAPSV